MSYWFDFLAPLLIMLLPMVLYFLADGVEHRRKEEDDAD